MLLLCRISLRNPIRRSKRDRRLCRLAKCRVLLSLLGTAITEQKRQVARGIQEATRLGFQTSADQQLWACSKLIHHHGSAMTWGPMVMLATAMSKAMGKGSWSNGSGKGGGKGGTGSKGGSKGGGKSKGSTGGKGGKGSGANWRSNCTRCNATDHIASDCPMIGEMCLSYGKVGHITAACRRPSLDDIVCSCCGQTGHRKANATRTT